MPLFTFPAHHWGAASQRETKVSHSGTKFLRCGANGEILYIRTIPWELIFENIKNEHIKIRPVETIPRKGSRPIIDTLVEMVKCRREPLLKGDMRSGDIRDSPS